MAGDCGAECETLRVMVMVGDCGTDVDFATFRGVLRGEVGMGGVVRREALAGLLGGALIK